MLKTLSVQHPVDLGGLSDRKCETCRKANEPFKHPVNLGDISMFQCVECHPRQDELTIPLRISLPTCAHRIDIQIGENEASGLLRLGKLLNSCKSYCYETKQRRRAEVARILAGGELPFSGPDLSAR